jgi:tRNA dimethylallyltransferase
VRRDQHAIPENTIVTLMGPTAAGKTELALRLADTVDVDIISVDSAMIYKGMDIGTAKPPAAVLRRYPHRLVDQKDPAESYSAAEFISAARGCIEAAIAAGRLPVLVGGTMLYFKALKHGLADVPPVNSDVRIRLALRAQQEGLPALHAELSRVDPTAALGIHPNNPQRLLRALEVYHSSGERISDFWARQPPGGIASALGCRLVELSIEPPRALIHERIARRFAMMLDAGLLDEVRGLMARGDLSVDMPSMRAVGYRQVWEHLSGAVDHDTMVVRAVAATRQLAKRQLTWLRSWSGKTLINDGEQAHMGAILQSIRGASIVPLSS